MSVHNSHVKKCRIIEKFRLEGALGGNLAQSIALNRNTFKVNFKDLFS